MPATIVESTDSELLMQFVKQNDNAAFRKLVERHARLVHSVCRRVLSNEQDVEDAFQATFLVLARKASSIRCRDSLVSWLFKVAHRVAVRAAVAMRSKLEAQLEEEPVIPSETLEQIQERESFEVLAVELERLPESCRAPMILFYFEGKSRRDAARELDCSDASLKSRLARGRRLLRQRLVRRGIAFSIVISVAAQQTTQAKAAISNSMIERTVSASIEYAATGQAGAAGTSQSINLAQGVQSMSSITLSKSTIAAILVITAGLLTTAGVGMHQLSADTATQNSKQSIDSKWNDQQIDQLRIQNAALALSDASAIAKQRTNASQKTSRQQRSVDLKERSPNEVKIEAALDQETQMEFTDTPLADAIEFLSELHQITIILDEQSLEDEGISSDVPINRVLSGIPLRKSLNIMLNDLHLTYLIEDDVMKITTKIAEEARKETRVYPINSLIDAGFEAEDLKRVVESQHKNEGAIVEALPGLLVIIESQQQHRKTAELLHQIHRAKAVKQ